MDSPYRRRKILLILVILQCIAALGFAVLPVRKPKDSFSVGLQKPVGTPLVELKSSNPKDIRYGYAGNLALYPGDYVMTVKYSCTSFGNSVSILSETLDSEGVGRSRWTYLDPQTDTAQIGFSIPHTIRDIQLAVDCKDTEGLRVESLLVERADSTPPANVQRAARVASWFFLCILMDIFIWLCLKNPEKFKIYALLLGVSAVMMIPMLQAAEYLPFGDDLYFHINRIFGIRDGLSRGVPWVKIQQNWYNGYGYAVGVYYGDALLYIPAVLNLAGIHIHACYKLFIFLMHLLTVSSAYYCFSRMYGERVGVCSSLIYSFLLFRWVDLYHRAAIGEFCAIAFLPFLLYAIYLLWKDNYRKSAIMFVIGFTGVLRTHVLSCELSILMVFLLLVLSPKKTFVKRRILSLVVSAFWVLIANLSYIVPFLDVALSRSLNVMKSTSDKKDGFLNQITSQKLSLLILLSFIPVLIALLSAMVHLYKSRLLSAKTDSEEKAKDAPKDKAKEEGRGASAFPMAATSVLAVLFLFASSSIFPWNIVVNIPVVGSLFVSLQFPWRFLTLAGILAAVLACEVLSKVDSTEQKGQMVWIFVVLFMMLPGLFYAATGYTSRLLTSFSPEAGALASRWNSQHEYLIEDTNVRDLVPEYTADGDVQIVNYSKDGTTVDFTYESVSGGKVELPVFNYPYYKAETESGEDLEISDGSNHRISVTVPGGSKGTVHVAFHTPVIWIVSLIVSILGVIVLFVSYLYDGKKPRRKEERKKVRVSA
ncbi:MAG: hypothetical protein K6E26_03360 [Clostridiales bacterium]|nr:hypothetical protein [Clostridiales bacterium]